MQLERKVIFPRKSALLSARATVGRFGDEPVKEIQFENTGLSPTEGSDERYARQHDGDDGDRKLTDEIDAIAPIF